MSNFGERLRELRISKNIMAKTMADTLDIGYRNYQRYERNEIDAPMSKLIALADAFNVSLDYLVGRSDEPERR